MIPPKMLAKEVKQASSSVTTAPKVIDVPNDPAPVVQTQVCNANGVVPTKSDESSAQATIKTAGAESGEKQMPSNRCECGALPKFFQIQSGKHVCEQCILGEIYADESYEDVYLKVLNKM